MLTIVVPLRRVLEILMQYGWLDSEWFGQKLIAPEGQRYADGQPDPQLPCPSNRWEGLGGNCPQSVPALHLLKHLVPAFHLLCTS